MSKAKNILEELNKKSFKENEYGITDDMLKKLNAIPKNVRNVLSNELEIPDIRIMKMSPEEMFDKYCTWEGLMGWGGTLWSTVEKLQELRYYDE